MYLSLLLAAVLTLSSLASPAPGTGVSSAPRQDVAQTVAGAATTVVPNPSRVASHAVSVKRFDIVVPPVTASDPVVAPGTPLQAQATSGVVVADRLVAPKRVQSEVVKAAGFQTLGVTWPDTHHDPRNRIGPRHIQRLHPPLTTTPPVQLITRWYPSRLRPRLSLVGNPTSRTLRLASGSTIMPTSA